MLRAQILRHQRHACTVATMARHHHKLPDARVRHVLAERRPCLQRHIGRQCQRARIVDVLGGNADRLLRLSSEAENALRNGQPRGTLRIGALESTSAARLPLVLSRYHQRYPDVQLELLTGTSAALVSSVHKLDLEAAFVAEPFTAQGLAMQLVFIEELVLIAPKSFGRIRSPKDIGKRTVIAFGTGCSYRRRLELWLATANVLPDRVMEFQSYHALVACVAAGSGIAVVPRSVIAMTGGVHEVIVSPLPAAIAKARTQLIWRPEHSSVALEALKKLLRGKQVSNAR